MPLKICISAKFRPKNFKNTAEHILPLLDASAHSLLFFSSEFSGMQRKLSENSYEVSVGIDNSLVVSDSFLSRKPSFPTAWSWNAWCSFPPGCPILLVYSYSLENLSSKVGSDSRSKSPKTSKFNVLKRVFREKIRHPAFRENHLEIGITHPLG